MSYYNYHLHYYYIIFDVDNQDLLQVESNWELHHCHSSFLLLYKMTLFLPVNNVEQRHHVSFSISGHTWAAPTIMEDKINTVSQWAGGDDIFRHLFLFCNRGGLHDNSLICLCPVIFLCDTRLQTPRRAHTFVHKPSANAKVSSHFAP